MTDAVSGQKQSEALMPVLVVKTVDQIEVWCSEQLQDITAVAAAAAMTMQAAKPDGCAAVAMAWFLDCLPAMLMRLACRVRIIILHT